MPLDIKSPVRLSGNRAGTGRATPVRLPLPISLAPRVAARAVTRNVNQNELDEISQPCESLRVTAETRQAHARTLQAKNRQTAPVRRRKPCRIIAFPAFERHGDQILEWFSAISGKEPSPTAVVRLVKSMRCEVARLERVRKSARHNNLASLVRHAANALETSEWDGARYLLITALGLMTPER
jgi:hypothetical protein